MSDRLECKVFETGAFQVQDYIDYEDSSDVWNRVNRFVQELGGRYVRTEDQSGFWSGTRITVWFRPH